MRTREQVSFEKLLLETLGPIAIQRARTLIDHGRINEVPYAMRKQIGILLTRKWAMSQLLGKETNGEKQ